jgi:hypothetical protein
VAGLPWGQQSSERKLYPMTTLQLCSQRFSLNCTNPHPRTTQRLRRHNVIDARIGEWENKCNLIFSLGEI